MLICCLKVKKRKIYKRKIGYHKVAVTLTVEHFRKGNVCVFVREMFAFS